MSAMCYTCDRLVSRPGGIKDSHPLNNTETGDKHLLNPLQAKGPMERALISGFCSVKRMRVFYPPFGRDTNPSQVSSQQTLVLIYLPRKDGKLSWLRWKRRLHKYSNLAKPGIELGTLWSEGRDLTNCANHTCHQMSLKDLA